MKLTLTVFIATAMLGLLTDGGIGCDDATNRRVKREPPVYSPPPLYSPPSSFYGPPSRPKPVYGPPGYAPPKPIYGPPKPVYGPPNFKPSQAYGPPSQTYGPPSQTYGPPSQTYGPPSQTYGPPSQTYGPPSQTYGPPSQSYGPPSVSYGSPSKTYGPPSVSYGPPSPGYGPPIGDYFSSSDHVVESYTGSFSHSAPAQIPIDFSSQPLSYDKPTATYGTPGALNSYGLPAKEHGGDQFGFEQSKGFSLPDPYFSSDTSHAFRKKTKSPDNLVKLFETNRWLESEKRLFPNHNYDGTGVLES